MTDEIVEKDPEVDEIIRDLENAEASVQGPTPKSTPDEFRVVEQEDVVDIPHPAPIWGEDPPPQRKDVEIPEYNLREDLVKVVVLAPNVYLAEDEKFYKGDTAFIPKGLADFLSEDRRVLEI
jgi:hypothetical protein